MVDVWDEYGLGLVGVLFCGVYFIVKLLLLVWVLLEVFWLSYVCFCWIDWFVMIDILGCFSFGLCMRA